MEPTLKVFLSSSQFNNEFIVEREGLPTIFSKQPLSACFVLWRIEDYASPEEIEPHYCKHVDDSDIMILLLGASYREAVAKEYHRAVAKKKPVFAFSKQVPDRDEKMLELIKEVSSHATYVTYSSFSDLVNKIESSLFQYYMRGTQKPEIQNWRLQHSKRKQTTEEEQSLRLLAGILVSDHASSTKAKVVEAVILEASFLLNKTSDQDTIINKAMEIIGAKEQTTRSELSNGLIQMIKSGLMRHVNNDKIELDASIRMKYITKRSNLADIDNHMYTLLYSLNLPQLKGINIGTYRKIVGDVIAQVVYDTAVDMAEQEFCTNSNPFSFNADEINRIVANTLLSILDLLQEEIGLWQSVIVSILQSADPEIITWLNRMRKAYWALTVLGMNPTAIEYSSKNLSNYCVYLDSHIVLRAMVEAGGESTMCRKIIRIGKKLGVVMRLSQAIFKEVAQAFNSANKTLYSANGDIIRAIKILDAVHRKSDIFDGYLTSKALNPELSWDNYINRFYSPSNDKKIKNYIENELSITVQPEKDFSSQQHGRIEDITQRLLIKRRQMVRPPEGLSAERYAEWERQYLLRTNESRQMAVIYELRQEDEDNKQYWFVTFDQFVYEVSAALAADNDDFYGFPCYMKPATWLEIITNASPEPLTINMFREVLLSRDIQQIADQLEAEVISQMLNSRIDQDIEDIQTLRYMFADIVNRPAVQEAYKEVLEAKGIKKSVASEKVKDKIIVGMKDRISVLEKDLKKKSEEVIAERKKTQKEEGGKKYYKRQLGHVISDIKKKKKR